MANSSSTLICNACSEIFQAPPVLLTPQIVPQAVLEASQNISSSILGGCIQFIIAVLFFHHNSSLWASLLIVQFASKLPLFCFRAPT